MRIETGAKALKIFSRFRIRRRESQNYFRIITIRSTFDEFQVGKSISVIRHGTTSCKLAFLAKAERRSWRCDKGKEHRRKEKKTN